MHWVISTAFGIALLILGRPAAALPPALTVAQLLEVCSSATVAEARGRGGRLGWQRMDEARIAPWRQSIERGGEQAVDVVGWFRGPQEGDGLLSFWTRFGVGGQRVCSYMIGDASGLVDGLSQALGAPARQETNGVSTSIEWAWTAGEVSFVQVGTTGLVTVTSPP